MTPACVSHPAAPIARPIRFVHALGPLVRWTGLENQWVGRLYALGVVIAVTALFVTAWHVHPGRRLMGTHQQLGLPPCGFLVITGLPCPTCGMTTAFAHTIHGEVIAAIQSQFAGFLLAIFMLVVGTVALIALLTGRRPGLNWYRINPVHTIWWVAAVFIGAWAFKIGIGLLDGSFPYRGG